MELYKALRPKNLSEVVGQPEVLSTIRTWRKVADVPQAIMFSGPSGCGKTTLARILRRRVRCGKLDFQELNCADFRGIDMVRDLRDRIGFAPISGKSRLFLIDEAHQLTSQAQDAFLKMLEDPPSHIYFMLATTEPGKIKRTIQTRCTHLRLKAIGIQDLETLILNCGVPISQEVTELIASEAEGSARKALVLLDQIKGIEKEEEQIEAIRSNDMKAKAIELARALCNSRSGWKKVSTLLKNLEEDPEGLRRMVLGYCNTLMLGGGKMGGRAYLIVETFSHPFFDTGKAGLTAACWDVVHGG